MRGTVLAVGLAAAVALPGCERAGPTAARSCSARRSSRRGGTWPCRSPTPRRAPGTWRRSTPAIPRSRCRRSSAWSLRRTPRRPQRCARPRARSCARPRAATWRPFAPRPRSSTASSRQYPDACSARHARPPPSTGRASSRRSSTSSPRSTARASRADASFFGIASSIATLDLLAGIAAGAAGLAALGVVIVVFGIRAPIRPFFIGASVLVYYLAFKFLGSGVHALHVVGIVPTTPAALPDIGILGLFPTWETTAVQMVLLAGAAAVIVLGRVRISSLPSRA